MSRLTHSYAKSVQSFILKQEQSETVYVRQEGSSGVYEMKQTLGGRGTASDPADVAYSAPQIT